MVAFLIGLTLIGGSERLLFQFDQRAEGAGWIEEEDRQPTCPDDRFAAAENADSSCPEPLADGDNIVNGVTDVVKAATRLPGKEVVDRVIF